MGSDSKENVGACDASALWVHDGDLAVDTLSLTGFGASVGASLRKWATMRYGLPRAVAAGNGYRVCQQWASGLRLYSVPINPEQEREDGEVVGDHVRFYVDGAFCRAHQDELVGFVRDWLACGVSRCTRFDSVVQFGEGKGRGLIERAKASCDARELAGPREFELRGKQDARTGKRKKGQTLYLGSRQSQRVTRIYDDGLKCGDAPEGERVRMETEYHGEEANLALWAWLASEARERGEDVEQGVSIPVCDGSDAGTAETVAECLASLVLARLNFVRRREGDRSVKRAEVSPWWAEFVATVKRTASVVRERVAESLARTAKWLGRQVGGVLSELIVAAGGDVSMVLDLAGVKTAGVAVTRRAAYELRLMVESAAAVDGLYRGRWAPLAPR